MALEAVSFIHVAGLLVAASAWVLLKPWFRPNPLSNLPMVGLEFGNEEKRRLAYLCGAKNIYQIGYRKFKDGVFRINTSRTVPIVVVHPRFLKELNKFPDHVLSVEAAVNESMEAKYTKLSTIPIIPHAIKTQLTPGLVRLNAIVAEEIQQAFGREWPKCEDWTPVQVHPKLLRVVAAASGRIFVGPEICSQEKYLDASINFTTDVMTAQNAVAQMQQWLRPLLAPRLPEVKRLNQRRTEAEEFLRPIIQKRRELLEGPGHEKFDDMLQWLMESQTESGEKADRELAEQQLGISFAAIHTTTLTATNAFYNLSAMPDVASELRAEIHSVLHENEGILTSKALASMKKLDSFLKETLRYHPFAFATYQRKVLKTVILSSGQVIPAGVTIECPTYAINYDDSLFEDAAQFDAFRFYKLRNKAATEDASAQNQFVSVSQNSLAFGYGRHACPGRFFAGNELKLIIAVALLNFEMKQTEGAECRYPNMEFAQLSIPDPTKEVLFRKIT